jgi:hypothetical protein
MATKYIVDNVSGQTINGDLVVTSAITASTFYGDGSNLSGITNTSPYKVYTALISQTGTNAPTANAILENTLGYTPSLIRGVTGIYEIGATASTLTQIYTIIGNNRSIANLDFISSSTGGPPPYKVGILTYSGGTLTDGLLSNTPIEIRVYN